MKDRLSVWGAALALGGLVVCNCGPTVTPEPPPATVTPDSAQVGLANPASVYCEDQGHTLELRTGDGGTYGVCVFADGSECEEWAYFRGECEPGGGQGPDIVYEGISFSYDRAISAGVNAETVPAGDPESVVEWDMYPTHYLFSFTGYAVPTTFHEPRIVIYPVAGYEAANEAARDVIADLRQLLADRPVAPEEIPSLPIWNAAQLMVAQVAYVEFQSGTGVRFLTQYGQAASPINNQDAFYSFQGLTGDGAYYVVAILPVSHPSFAADAMDVPGGDWNAFADDFFSYAEGMEQQIDALDGVSFTPSLLLFDAMIRSLRVEP
jgi:putative hemolysin